MMQVGKCELMHMTPLLSDISGKEGMIIFAKSDLLSLYAINNVTLNMFTGYAVTVISFYY